LRIALREHGELWSGMDALARMLGEGERSAPATSVCQTLLAQLAAHNAKEEPVVYPKPGHLLSVEDIDKLEEWIRPFAGPGAAPRRAAADGPPLKT
jgi:regulator of cell morphogenesis and NO signaling